MARMSAAGPRGGDLHAKLSEVHALLVRANYAVAHRGGDLTRFPRDIREALELTRRASEVAAHALADHAQGRLR